MTKKITCSDTLLKVYIERKYATDLIPEKKL